MKLKEFGEIAHGRIKVRSAYNGKILARNFDPERHANIADREVSTVWAEVEATKSAAFSNIALPILCVYVNGREEYFQEHGGEGDG